MGSAEAWPSFDLGRFTDSLRHRRSLKQGRRSKHFLEAGLKELVCAKSVLDSVAQSERPASISFIIVTIEHESVAGAGADAASSLSASACALGHLYCFYKTLHSKVKEIAFCRPSFEVG